MRPSWVSFGQSNVNFPIGEVIGKHKNTSVRTSGKFQTLDEIRNMDIPTAKGVIKLSEIAVVKDTIETITSASRFNGKTPYRSISRSVPTQTW